MPFLRFTRDKRGYETTTLVHAVRRDGRSRNRILYWFRTPPGVRVGRPALDEEAIRWIEEHNPDVDFDWPKILEAKPPAVPPPFEERRARPRRESERSGPGYARGRAPRAGVSSARQPVQPTKAPLEPLEPQEPQEPSEPLEPPDSLDAVEPVELLEPMEPAEPLEPLELLEPIEPFGTPEPAEPVAEVPPMPVEAAFGPEQLTRLRARYAELLARITERGGSPERIEALRAQALPLDPDGWVTDAEVRAGFEGFETRMRDLRSALGLRRRRRSRRGGRRRKPDAPPLPKPEA